MAHLSAQCPVSHPHDYKRNYNEAKSDFITAVIDFLGFVLTLWSGNHSLLLTKKSL